MSVADLAQGWILLSACMSVFFLSRHDHYYRWGFVVGLLGQPAWLWITFTSAQFGMFFSSVFFTWVYLGGCWREFVGNRGFLVKGRR